MNGGKTGHTVTVTKNPFLRWLSSSGLSAHAEQVAQDTLRQTLPITVVVCGLIALIGATIHIVFLQPGFRPLLVPAHVAFSAIGIYWLYRRPTRLNAAAAIAGWYLSSVIGIYMFSGQLNSALHFGILIVGGMFLAMDRRLLLALSTVWALWLMVVGISWLPQGQGLSVIVITLIAAGGGAMLRHSRILSVERMVALQQDLELATKERAAAVQRVKEAEKLESLGIMAAGVAHDYNNLLVGVVGGVDLAKSAHSPQEQQDALETISKSADALVGLSAQLLEVAGGRPILKSAVDLNTVIKDRLTAIAPLVGQQDRIRFKPGENLPLIYAEAESLGQVVLNLVTNALHHASDKPGAIEIVTCEQVRADETAQVLLSVEDDGPGVPDILASRIFDPFFSTASNGRGLGLATTRTIIARHDGTITVRKANRGALFCVTLPAMHAVTQLGASDTNQVLAATQPNHTTILLVDDDEHVRNVTVRMLQHLGFNVVTASSGEEALGLFASLENKPDLAIIDVLMRDMDGIQTLNALRDIAESLPAVLCSGFHSATASTDLPQGVLFLAKPFRADQLSTALNELTPERSANPMHVAASSSQPR